MHVMYNFGMNSVNLLCENVLFSNEIQILLNVDRMKEVSAEPYNTVVLPNDTHSKNSSCNSSIPATMLFMNFLLLDFIHYLQLLQYIPWSTPMSICDRLIEVSKKKTTNVSTSIDSRNKRRKIKQSLKPGACGLDNIGNTCFMNSAIQCLSNIPALTDWAKQQHIPKYQKTVTHAYTSLIQSMWSGENSHVIPNDIKTCVSQHAPIFTDYTQKDSHEFMNSLLNALHSECIENDPSNEQRSSIITKLFQILTESRVTCLKCNTYCSLEEPTYCLPLPLGKASKVTLERLIENFQKEEPLIGKYYCSNCEGLRSAKQKTSIRQPLPPVIIVHLKRFTFNETNDKIDTFVEYPITDWNVDGSSDSLYDLVAVSMHAGNSQRGHYTTYARLNGSDQWYHFNDSLVEALARTDNIVNRNAYVLVYLKKN